MNVRELAEGTEYDCDEEGEVIRCPVCEAVWMKDVEGDVEHGFCSHLRFVFCPDADGPFEAFNEWDSEKYFQRFEEIAAAHRDQDEGLDYRSIFQILPANDVDEVLYKCWDDFPLVQWEIFWGYGR